MIDLQGASLYIHIPLCKKKCAYCDFFSVPYSKSFEDQLISAISLELEAYFLQFPDITISTVYFGGGTPSCLSPAGLERLFKGIDRYVSFDSLAEATIEMNPDSVTTDVLAVCQQHSISRISLGVQSFSDEVIYFLGRPHQVSDTRRAIVRIVSAGFKNFSLDLMIGLPNQTLDHVQYDIDQAILCDPTHLSVYTLTIEPGTRLYQQQVQSIDSERGRRFYREARLRLQSKGYYQYEVSAFAKKGFQGLHNLNYWQYGNYIGLGPNASSFFNGHRYKNIKNIKRYLKDPVSSLKKACQKQSASRAQRIRSYLIGALRLINGFLISDINARFQIDFCALFQDQVSELCQNGLLSIRGGRCKVTIKGLYLLDGVIETFY